MSKPAVLALVHLLSTGPEGLSTPCGPEASSAERSLSDRPYEATPGQCKASGDDLLQAPGPRRMEEPMGNAARESASSPTQRMGFTMVGTGAALAVLGGSFFLCSKVSPIEGTREYCKAIWPWTAGVGGLVFASGLGVIGYNAWISPDPTPRGAMGLRANVGATWAWDPLIGR